ncbi:MAG: Flp pilus assembly protein CpaB [Janthinobacterium lividum]
MLHLVRIAAVVLVLREIVLGVYAWLLGRKPLPTPAAVAPAVATVQPAGAAPLFPIVVTMRPVPAGQPIAADALCVAQLPIRPAGTFGTADDLVGRVPVFDLAEGTPLFENHLAAGLAQRLGEGERAVAVRADEVMGVGNRVQPGDFVDVFVVLKSDGKEIDRGQARLLLARKRVLTFGTASVENMQPPTQPSNRAEPVRTAVLAIPVAEVNRLALGESAGRLLLALRNPADMAWTEPTLYAGATSISFVASGTSGNVPSHAMMSTAASSASRSPKKPSRR